MTHSRLPAPSSLPVLAKLREQNATWFAVYDAAAGARAALEGGFAVLAVADAA